jgi:flagellar biosynthetic protein FliP
MQTQTTHFHRPAKRSALRRFLRHYGEMVLAMVAGMAVLTIPFGAVLPGGNTMMLLNMGVSMTIPMVAWMSYRGHGRRANAEMAASMLVPTFAAIALYRSDLVEDFGAIMLGEHVVMLIAMAAVMLRRPSEYLHHAHGHARVQMGG